MKDIRPKILIVDDVVMNRTLLSDLLCDQYDILEAKNGNEALLILQEKTTEISLVLLDMVMPEKDGLEVLSIMNKNGWINEIPIIMISSEKATALVEEAYALGATDFINRPFDQMVVQNRVKNTIRLYTKQRHLSDMVASQIYDKTRNNSMMVTMLSHIVEFRNGESGLHVLHINTITELLLRELLKHTDKYKNLEESIPVISTASSMHDIGKITIPDEILNKPGRFTPEEFNIMKLHSMNGALMLNKIPFGKDEPLVKYAYEICRWHHERWDGKGYPDGLKGDEIPISAQIVSIADVYDALTSDRCYKKAFTHDKALEMIRNNECGVFNPLLLTCLDCVADKLAIGVENFNWNFVADRDFTNIATALSKDPEHPIYTQAFRRYTYEQEKCKFFASLLDGISFEYTFIPSVLKLCPKGAELLNLPQTIAEPEKRDEFWGIASRDSWDILLKAVQSASPINNSLSFESKIIIQGKQKNCKILAERIWKRNPNGDAAIYAIYGHITIL